jgi:hypothetical protein
MRLAVVLALILLGLGWWAIRLPATPPALIAGMSDEGLRGAPCPARSLDERDERKKHGPQSLSPFAARLQALYPLGAPEAALRNDLVRQGFKLTTPCPNDDSVLGARWRSSSWGEPDAYVYWRVDAHDNLSFVDGHVNRAD